MTLEANEVHLTVDDESKSLLSEVDKESEKEAQCDKPTLEGTNKDLPESPRYATQESAVKEAKPGEDGSKESTQVPQNTRHDSVQHEDDFIAKDLLGFAWQIARGMVSD